MACGGEHTTVLLATGEVYTFGSGKLGQLGHPGTKNEHYPKLVKSLKDMRRKVFQVACGNNCTIILAGPFQPPTLFELCLEVVMKEDPKSIEHLGLLPQEKLLQMTGKSSP